MPSSRSDLAKDGGDLVKGCSSSRLLIRATVASRVVWASQAVSGRGTVRVRSCPPGVVTGQPDVRGDRVAVFEQRDVGDQQPDEPLAVFHAGSGVVPQGGQVVASY